MLLFDAIQLLRASTCVLGIDRPDLNRRNAVENITQPYLEVWSFQALRPFNYTLQGSLGGSPEQLVRPLSLTSPVSCVDLPPHKTTVLEVHACLFNFDFGLLLAAVLDAASTPIRCGCKLPCPSVFAVDEVRTATAAILPLVNYV